MDDAGTSRLRCKIWLLLGDREVFVTIYVPPEGYFAQAEHHHDQRSIGFVSANQIAQVVKVIRVPSQD